MLEALLTALVAGFAPWTLLVMSGLLARERPLYHALVFLAAAASVALVVGFLVVEALGSTNLENRRHHHSVSPAIDLGLGLAILVFVPLMARRTSAGFHLHLNLPDRFRLRRGGDRERSSRRVRRERGAGVLAVVALGLWAGSPSPLYLASLHSITKAQPNATVGTLEVLLVVVLVLAMAELPLICFVLAPERTTAVLKSANEWLSRHGRLLVILAATAAGCYFTINGLVRLLA